MLIANKDSQAIDRDNAANGFTILELMLASAVFTIILLIVAVGVISFTNSYYKGIVGSKTQAATRSIIASLAQSIQFGKTLTQLNGGSGVLGLCIDNTLYSYKIGQEITDVAPNSGLHQGYHGLVVSTGSDCSAATPSIRNTATLPVGSRELLGQHMRLSTLNVTPTGNLYTVHVRLIYGDDDLLTPTLSGNPSWGTELCAGATAGSQFCAVSDLTTTVERRLP